MKRSYRKLLGASAVALCSLFSLSSAAEPAKTVVLVHGAFADGSSWNKVIPILQAQGLKTIAVQNPLTSLADDVQFTNRAIANAQGPVVLVGHSWGGVVITQAGDNEKVKSLVYVSAFAPKKNQHIHHILDDAHKVQKIPTVEGFKSPIVDEAGFIRLAQDTVVNYFASDLPQSEAKLIAAGQGKLHKAALDQAPSVAAWETKPSWFVVSTKDQMIAPDVLRNQAKSINATTIELPTSHVPMLSKPQAVADIIIDAANAQ